MPRRPIVTDSIAATVPVNDDPGDVATFKSRVGGYVVDMVIFGAVSMVIIALAGLVLLLLTDMAMDDPNDGDLWLGLGIVAIGTPVVWSLMNLALLRSRGQTGGQYVAGVRLSDERGGRLRTGQLLAWWFAGNPLLYSWPMALVAGTPLLMLALVGATTLSVFIWALVSLICFAMPIAAFVSGLIDAQNRALHDRVAGVTAMPVN